MTGEELDRALRAIIQGATRHNLLASTAKMMALGFDSRTSYAMLEDAVKNNPTLQKAHK